MRMIGKMSGFFCAYLALSNGALRSEKLITIDGSSTVEPLSSAISELYGEAETARTKKAFRPPVVGTSGTGGGFKKFISGQIDIVGASRPVLDEEKAKLKEAKIEYLELKVGLDGLAVVVKKGSPIKELSLAELKTLWEPESKIKKWSDLRGKGHALGAFPDKTAKLYGPGPDSGTFDFFTERVLNTKKKARTDYVSSEDDNTLVTGISREESALGYFGFAYYKQHEKALSLVGITDEKTKKTIVPSEDNIKSGEYPLSRPLFIYVNLASLKEEPVQRFTQFYLDKINSVIKDVGYFEIKPEESKQQKEALASAIAKLNGKVKVGKK